MPSLPRKSTAEITLAPLPEERHLQAVYARLFAEIQPHLNPRLPSEPEFIRARNRRVLSVHMHYYRQGVHPTLTLLKKRGFVAVLNEGDENRPAWVSIQKKFEYVGLLFKAELNCSPKIARAQIRISVRRIPE